MNTIYEVLFVENGSYFINFYANGMEYAPFKIKLDEKSFDKWKVDKVER